MVVPSDPKGAFTIALSGFTPKRREGAICIRGGYSAQIVRRAPAAWSGGCLTDVAPACAVCANSPAETAVVRREARSTFALEGRSVVTAHRDDDSLALATSLEQGQTLSLRNSH